MRIKSIKELNLKDKRTFLRVDFNVPLKGGVIEDDTRIEEALPTIKYALDKGAKLILATHLGRPKGEKKAEYSLKSVADYINKKYFRLAFVDDCIGESVKKAIDGLGSGEAILLENLRFYKGEEKNDPTFVKALSEFTEVYVNDAFGTSHREHASVYGLALKIKDKGAGFLIEKEVNALDKLIVNPEKPFAAILGGAKVSDKIGVIESLLDKIDKLFIGGAMAYTFLKFNGFKVGKSLIEIEMLPTIDKIYKKAMDKNVEIFLPVDHLASTSLDGQPIRLDNEDIDDNLMGLDIGEKTIEKYKRALKDVKTILWNGPMGVFEKDQYSKGTFEIANFISSLDAFSVVGGGDSVSAVHKAGVADKISHISTGGGASLEYIEKGSLPCIDILKY
jgi:phosphoglycerate kinase